MARYRRVRHAPRSPDKTNPFRGLERQPYFGELPLPSGPELKNRMTEDYAEVLARFYCERRIGGVGPDADLLDFVSGRGSSNVFVLWGDVGIGKSWFLRHFFLCRLPREDKIPIEVCIVDMRYVERTKDPEVPAELYSQLTAHFRRVLGEANEEDDVGRPSALTVKSYLKRIEQANKRVCLVIDNADLFPQQQDLADLVVSVAGGFPGTCYIVIPLRSSTREMTNQLSRLGQTIVDGALISKVDFVSMLERRFAFDKHGVSLDSYRIDEDPTKCPAKTYPDLWARIALSRGVQFVLDLAGSNARQCLQLMGFVFHSKSIGSVEELESDYFCMSALMLSPGEIFRPDQARILNLFDNDNADPTQAGINALIRFRVMDYFVRGMKSVRDATFEKFLEAFGYEQVQVDEILDLFIGAGLVRDDDGVVCSARELQFATCTDLGRKYLVDIIFSFRYVICIKRGMIINQNYITPRGNRGYEEIRDEAFLEYVREEESIEALRLQQWEERFGELPITLKPTPISEELQRRILDEKRAQEHRRARRAWERELRREFEEGDDDESES